MKVETDADLVVSKGGSRDGAEVTSAGRSFHARAPATRKTTQCSRQSDSRNE